MSLVDFNEFNKVISAKKLPYTQLSNDELIKYFGNYAKLISSKKTS